MKKLILTAVCALLAGSSVAQELLYPAKYHVYKIALSRFVSFDEGYRDLKTWKVDLLMKTGRSRVLVYHTTGSGTYRTAVGAPSYRLDYLANPFRHAYDDIVTETYGGAIYTGQIGPPSAEVRNQSQPSVIWRSTVSGNKSLNLDWITDKAGRNGLKDTYRLTFYCRPVE
ncbi:hypothetical protein GCM10027048_30140 [Hymenobacter coalescens]